LNYSKYGDNPLFGLSSYAYRWAVGLNRLPARERMTPEKLIEISAMMGLNSVQLCDNMPLASFSTKRLRMIRDTASSSGIRLETGIRGIDSAALTAAIKTASLLEAGLIRIVFELDRSVPTNITFQLDRISATLSAVREWARTSSIKLAIENHATLKSADILYLLEKLDPEIFGACLDTMNSTLLLENPIDSVQTLAPYILSVHLKDFSIVKYPDCFKIEGTSLGEGSLDLPHLVDEIVSRRKPESWHVELYIKRMKKKADTLQWEKSCVKKSVSAFKNLFDIPQ
jgi:sugar phosphate isomerase/epimerase